MGPRLPVLVEDDRPIDEDDFVDEEPDDGLVGSIEFCSKVNCFPDKPGKTGNKNTLIELGKELGFELSAVQKGPLDVVVEGVGTIRIEISSCMGRCSSGPNIMYGVHSPRGSARSPETFDWAYFLEEVRRNQRNK